MIVIAFVVLATVGTLGRVLISDRLNESGFPLGTMIVNVAGAFLVGLLATASPDTATIVGTGALGSFTTFSTLSHESLHICRREHALKGMAYLTLTIVLGIGAAWLGLSVAG